MTTLSIYPKFGDKTAKIIGTVSAGEHVDVRIIGGASLLPSSTLRFRITCGKTIAVFPHPESNDSWDTEGSDLKCHLNLNTVQAEIALRHGCVSCHALLEQTADDEHTLEPTLFFDDEFDILPWRKIPGETTPFNLDAYPDVIASFERRLNEFGVVVNQTNDLVTQAKNAATGANNRAADAERSARDAEKSALSARRSLDVIDGQVEDARNAAVQAMSSASAASDSAAVAEEKADVAAEKSVESANSAAEARLSVNLHVGRTDNPHGVTKAQVGLSKVDNTSDFEKPVSSSQRSAIEAVENAARSAVQTEKSRAELVEVNLRNALNAEIRRANEAEANLETSKQNALTNRQIEAINSGIDAAKVARILLNTHDLSSEVSRAKSEEARLRAAIEAIGVMDFVVADVLPEPSEECRRKLYLIPSSNPETKNVKDEFICVKIENAWKWEQVGSTAITIEFDEEPTEYSQKAVRSGGVFGWVLQKIEAVKTWASDTFASSSHVHDQGDVTGLDQALSGKQPTISDLDDIRAGATAGSTASQPGHTHTASQVSGLKQVATSGSYNDLTDKPTIPTVPTKLSEFQNDSGFITDKDAATVIKLTNGNETMAEILLRLTHAKSEGCYPLFDPSSFAVNPPAKLVAIDIDASGGSVHVQDVVTGRLYFGQYVLTETIGEVLAKMVQRYCDILVTATRKDGGTVSDVNVYLYEGTDDTGRLVETKAYSGSPVTFRFVEGEPYFIKMDNITGLFNPTTASGIANVVNEVGIIYGDADHITTFEDIKMALVALGTVEAAKEKLIGKVIADTWVDLDGSGSGDATPSQDAAGHPIWLDPMICTNVEMVDGADGNQHLAAIMMRQYATVKTVQFDPRNHDEATEEVAQAGITYYGATSAAPTSTSAITVLSLSPGDPIPYSSYAKVYRNSVNDSTKFVVASGYNRYQYSSWRQYLTASKTAGKGMWWTKQRVGQVPPSTGDYNIHPYQAGCSDALLAAIKPIKRTVSANTVTDGGGTYQICDPFWLPAHVEMFGKTDTTEGSTQEEYWHYISGDSTKTPSTSSWAPRKQYQVNGKSSAVAVWLRSASASNSYYVYHVTTSGTINNSYPYYARAGVPACAIY